MCALRALRVAVSALAVAIYANAVLGFFPWTRGLARAVFAYAWSALAGALAALAAFPAQPRLHRRRRPRGPVHALKAAKFLAIQDRPRGPRDPFLHPEWAVPTYRVIRFLVLVLAAAVMFPCLPGPISLAFQAMAIFLGIVLSLGSMPVVSNVVSGVLLTYMRPFSLGDRVEIADAEGHVIERNLLLVRVRTAENVDVTVSSSTVLGSVIPELQRRCAGNGGPALRSTVTVGAHVPCAGCA